MRRSYNILLMAMLVSMVSCIAEPKLSGEDYSSPESVFMAKVIGDIKAEHKSGELLVELDEATQERIEAEGLEVVAEELFSNVEFKSVEPAIRRLPKNDTTCKALAVVLTYGVGLYRFWHWLWSWLLRLSTRDWEYEGCHKKQHKHLFHYCTS